MKTHIRLVMFARLLWLVSSSRAVFPGSGFSGTVFVGETRGPRVPAN